jgi:hypothetical protein
MIYLKLVSQIIAVLLIIQSLEYIYLSRKIFKTGLGSWPFVRDEWHLNSTISIPIFNLFFKDRYFVIWQIIQVILAAWLFIHPHFLILTGLLFIHLITMIRFRGLFNGGSDSLTLVILMALTVAYIQPEKWGAWVLYFIAFQSALTYFRAGLAKLKNKNWRNGTALSQILNAPTYSPHRICLWLKNSPTLSKFISVGIILFECILPFSVFHSATLSIFLGLAFLFHLTNAYLLGLNRFVWAWSATYPALYFVSTGLSL